MRSNSHRVKRQRVNNLTLIGLILLGTCLAAMPLGAQKYDHSWLLGYLPNDSSEQFGGTLLTFGKDTIYTKFQELNFNFSANAQICDSSGRLKLVSDGCNIFNGNIKQINSEPLGYNTIYDLYCARGYPLTQGLLILPDLYDSSKYYLFRNQISDEFLDESILFWELNEYDSDRFEISDDQKLIEDEIADQITATQHGNGKDWWLITPKVGQGYYITKIGRFGPESPKFQNISIVPPELWRVNCCDHASFSPDGNTYVSSSRWTGVRIFDFDRCEGVLSRPRFIPLNYDTVELIGVTISPNNEWLYLSFGDRIIQYDLNSEDIARSGIKVAVYDGHTAPFPTTFYQMKLTPNDRIVVSSTNGVHQFTQILNPNERGLACNVQQHSLQLKTHSVQQLPNFPNFRAGRLKGSLCDTLLPTYVRPHTLKTIRLYPNPALDQFEVEMPGGYDRLDLLDLHGRLILSHDRQGPVVVSGLPHGIYTVRAWKNRQVVGVSKVAVMR